MRQGFRLGAGEDVEFLILCLCLVYPGSHCGSQHSVSKQLLGSPFCRQRNWVLLPKATLGESGSNTEALNDSALHTVCQIPQQPSPTPFSYKQSKPQREGAGWSSVLPASHVCTTLCRWNYPSVSTSSRHPYLLEVSLLPYFILVLKSISPTVDTGIRTSFLQSFLPLARRGYGIYWIPDEVCLKPSLIIPLLPLSQNKPQWQPLSLTPIFLLTNYMAPL